MLDKENSQGNNEDIEIPFDERRFLRLARWRSFWRTALISLSVALAVFFLAFVLPELMLAKQEFRIDEYYPDLVRFSEPNTIAVKGPSYNVRLLGRQTEYYLLRLVGGKPCPVGTTIVDFDVWGGEQTRANPLLYASGPTKKERPGGAPPAASQSDALPPDTPAKGYLAPYGVPKLEFFYPASKYEKIAREFDALKNIPSNDLVEMAISFRKTLTLQEIKKLLPTDLQLMWGAVSAFNDEEYRKNSYLAERLVGNPYLNQENGEKEFLAALERLSRVPSYHASRLKRTVSFLRENGIKYYGVVVVGNPGALEKLFANDLVTGAVLGIVTTPY